MATSTRNSKATSSKQMKLTTDSGETDNFTRELCRLREDISVIKVSMEKLSKKSDIQEIVDKAIGEALRKSCGKLKEEIKREVFEKTEDLVKLRSEEVQDKLTCIEIDIENLQTEVGKRDKRIQEMQDLLVYQQRRIEQATEAANRNEQYSRKYNVRINGLAENRNENLREVLPDKIHQLTGVRLDGYYDVVAVHRLPSNISPRPVIVKFFNNDIKSMVMRHKKDMRRSGLRVNHDITMSNKELMDQVGDKDEIEYSWFYNGNVYGLSKETKRRIRFNLGDNISETIVKHKVQTQEGNKH